MRFTKMQGVGNDFVVVDGGELPPHVLLPALAVQTCDRKFGIGADGLLVVSRDAPGAAFRMRMFNPDGSEDMCGNGLRCVSLYALRAGWLAGQTAFTVAVKDGARNVRLLDVAEDGRAATWGVDMGVPRFPGWKPSPNAEIYTTGMRVVGYPLVIEGETYHITVVNTGSIHTVIFGVVPPDEATFQRVSPQIENHPLFPERTSVLWATPQGDSTVAARIWERGAGETWGCGTGACAVGVAAQLYQTVGMGGVKATVDVVSKGGTLRITWPGEGASVDMIGPAQIVYDGEFALDPAF
jgi:diaminopimelate epimerase